DRYANEVVKAMKLSELTPPDDVQELADQFLEKVRQGKERHSSSKSGFGGKGLEKLDKDRSMVKKIQKMTYGSADGDALGDDDEDEEDNQVELDSDGEIVVSSKRKAKAKDSESVRKLAKTSSSSRPSFNNSPVNSHVSISTAYEKQVAAVKTPEASTAANSVSVSTIPSNGGISEATRAAILAAQAAARRLNIGAESGPRSEDNLRAPATLSVVDQINQQLGISPTSSAHKRDGVSPGGPFRGRAENASSRDSSVRGSGGNTLAAAAATAGAGDSASGAHSGSAATAATAAIPVGAFGCELDINDYPQTARWKATNRDTLTQIIEQTGVAITTRGIFVPAGKPAPEGERKLYLSIEGDSERAVERAKTEIKRILTEATVQIMEQDARAGGGSGRYSVV
ncbi:pre-mRNA processing RNA-helicase, partial [Coemansia sp. RSA 2559]